MKQAKQISLLYLLGTFLVSVLLGVVLQKIMQPKELYKYLLFALILGFCAWIMIWRFREKIDDQKVILLLFVLAFAARLVYILDISVTVNQHDTSSFSVLQNYGHTGYIRYLMENLSLPDFDVRGKSQFYHPPLHHLICAVWMKLQMTVGFTLEEAAENIQVLTLFYSMVSLYAAKRILDLFQIKGIPYYTAFSIIAFHPTFFLLAGSINNDGLSVMFAFLAVYAALLWYRNPKWYRILAVAACIGLSMCAKLATGVIAPAVAFLFLFRFFQNKGAKEKGKLVGQFALFGTVCIPLGIGWQVRNYLQFGVPLTYVPRLSDTADQYLGDYSVWDRFFDFRSLIDFGVMPARTGQQSAEYFEHNIPLAAVKTSLFGEYSVWKKKWMLDGMATVLFWIAVVIAVAAVFAAVFLLVRLLIKKKDDRSENAGAYPAELLSLVIYTLTILGSYVVFCFEYPHFCSMDFRYIVPLLLTGTVFIALAMKAISAENGDRSKAAVRVSFSVLLVLTVIFSFISVVLYPLYY